MLPSMSKYKHMRFGLVIMVENELVMWMRAWVNMDENPFECVLEQSKNNGSAPRMEKLLCSVNM